jgi:hypothetical protein
MLVKLQLVGWLILGLLPWNPVSADAPALPSGIPAPKGFVPCALGDPVATAEARVAAKLGGALLGCFQSERKMMTLKAGKPAAVPVDNAFALALHGEGYTQEDLDQLLSTVRQQWKGFDPLRDKLKDAYFAWLNEVIKDGGSGASPTLIEVKPVLVSIDRPESNFYLVTSIRTYVVELNGKQVKVVKINSDAVALSRSKLIRLTVQRTLGDPADVEQVQGAIADWARVAAKVLPPSQR